MRERQDQLDALNTRLLAVTFEPEDRVREYRQRERIDVPLLRDPRREAYRAFGIQRASLPGVLAPRTIWYYITRILRGRLPRFARTDWYQLGGDVLLNAHGEVIWVYRSREPADRPSVTTILKEIRTRA